MAALPLVLEEVGLLEQLLLVELELPHPPSRWLPRARWRRRRRWTVPADLLVGATGGVQGSRVVEMGG